MRALQTSGIDVLPSWKSVCNLEKSITPEIQHLPDGLGVKYCYRDAIDLTIKRIFNVIEDKQQIPDEEMTLHIKDGSGSHSVFNQHG